MRGLAARFLRWLAEACVRLYYPRRTIEGVEHIPATGPTLYVANHPNGLLDPLVLRVSIHRAVRFLAKSTLWGNPFGRLAMDAFKCLPVYRQQDVAIDERGQSVARNRNEESFARCRAELSAGAELALYPEGTSHSDPRLKPLKSGAARLALSAAAESGARSDRPPLLVIPVGLHYEDKAIFRSGVHLVVGAAIDLRPHMARFAVDQRLAIDQVTDEIRARLDELVLQAETRELLAGIARVASWTAADPDDDAPERRHARSRELLAAYSRLKASDPERVEQVAKAARQYARILERLGVEDPWALETPRVTAAGVAAALGRTLLMAPAAIWGIATSWVPYRLAGVVAAKMTNDEDVLSTIKLIDGAAFLAFAWLVEAALIGWRWGAVWGCLSFLIAPAAGYAALRFAETLRVVAEAARHLGWRTRSATTRRLGDRRRRLAEQVAGALREAGK